MTMIYSWVGRPKHSEVRTGTNSWNKKNHEIYDMTSYLDMDSWINRAPVDSHQSLVQKWMWILHSGFIALIAASQNPISMIPFSFPARFVIFLVRKKLRTSWENHHVANTVTPCHRISKVWIFRWRSSMCAAIVLRLLVSVAHLHVCMGQVT